MIAALKQIIVPSLRKDGFTGSFPHFRRSFDQRVDLITFQFDKWGGGFIIEISQCPIEGVTTAWGTHIGSNKVNAHDLHPNDRLRLQPKEGGSTDDWFRYDAGDYETTARAVIPFLAAAERWWQNRFSQRQAQQIVGRDRRERELNDELRMMNDE